MQIFYCRAIDIPTLIGNIGGYIGLCLGYSLLQIPELVVFLVKKFSSDWSEHRLNRRNVITHSKHNVNV